MSALHVRPSCTRAGPLLCWSETLRSFVIHPQENPWLHPLCFLSSVYHFTFLEFFTLVTNQRKIWNCSQRLRALKKTLVSFLCLRKETFDKEPAQHMQNKYRFLTAPLEYSSLSLLCSTSVYCLCSLTFFKMLAWFLRDLKVTWGKTFPVLSENPKVPSSCLQSGCGSLLRLAKQGTHPSCSASPVSVFIALLGVARIIHDPLTASFLLWLSTPTSPP